MINNLKPSKNQDQLPEMKKYQGNEKEDHGQLLDISLNIVSVKVAKGSVFSKYMSNVISEKDVEEMAKNRYMRDTKNLFKTGTQEERVASNTSILERSDRRRYERN